MITETAGETYNNVNIQYGIAQGTASPVLSNTIQLVETGYDATNSTRTFSLSNAGRDILALASAAGAGTSYRFDVTVNAAGTDANGDDVIISGTGSRRRASFTASGVPSTATVSANNIVIAPDGTAGSTYYFPSTGATPQFPGATFTSSTNANGVAGAFDVNNGQLRLTNTAVTTTETGANTITSVVLYYRTRAASGTGSGGAFQPITLTQSGGVTNGTRTFFINSDPNQTLNTNPQPNLIATPAVTVAGNYVIDVYYQASVYNSSTGVTSTITYPPTGVFSANFAVSGTPIAQTIWTGALNDNWFDPANWSNGVPNANTNALIRDLGAGNNVPYPNINSDASKTTSGGTVLYSNIGSGPAMTRDLIMGGSSQASRSITRLEQGQLKVYGRFGNDYDSFIQRENTIMEFAGVNQIITGGSFVRVDISGGGTKTLNGVMNITESLNFLTPGVATNNAFVVNKYTTLDANAGILATDITQPTASLVVLSDRALINGNNGAQINGETDDSYLYGFIRTSRQGVLVGETRTYGNMGMTLTFTGANNPGNVEITRNTVEAYTPINGRYGIRRIFGVRPSDPQTTTGGLTATMVFRYRDSETQRLGGATTSSYGTGSIPEENLTIFVSSNSGNTFQLIGRDGPPNTTTNEVTKTGVRSFATITLGDISNPLPVSLIAFDARRTGNDVQLSWATATEVDNSGFEVQVSTDGTTFRKLTFVASKSANSTTLLTYSYLDTEAAKSTTRYYRLRQIDISGKEWYSPVRVVSFTGSEIVAQSSLTAYPNPFAAGDQLKLVLQTVVVGSAHVQVTDMLGREVSKQNFSTINGIQEVSIPESANFSAGIYVAKITLATGEVKTLRIQKR